MVKSRYRSIGFGYPYDDIVIEIFTEILKKIIGSDYDKVAIESISRSIGRYTTEIMMLLNTFLKKNEKEMIDIIYSVGNSNINNNTLEKLNERLGWNIVQPTITKTADGSYLFSLNDLGRNKILEMKEKITTLKRNDLIILFLYCIKISDKPEDDLFLLGCIERMISGSSASPK